MYIEFSLPRGQPDHALVNHHLTQALEKWSRTHNIPYRSKLIKFKKRIVFDHDDNYAFFLLTWVGEDERSFWTNFKLIRDLNNKI